MSFKFTTTHSNQFTDHLRSLSCLKPTYTCALSRPRQLIFFICKPKGYIP